VSGVSGCSFLFPPTMSTMPSDDELVERLCDLLARRPGCRVLVTLLAEGLSRKQIAAQMGLSAHTVDWHVKRLYRDLGVSGAVVLARLVILRAPDPSRTEKVTPPPGFGGCSLRILSHSLKMLRD
jgi:DNA-binding CsgD family transcriptional regulator